MFDPPISIAANLMDVKEPYFGDLTGDGIMEIILGSTGTGEVIGLELAGDSVFALDRLIKQQIYTRLMELADVDQDGYPDIIRGRDSLGTQNQNAKLTIHWGNADGSYTTKSTASPGIIYERVSAADLTGDGIMEIVAFDYDILDIYTVDIANRQLSLSWHHSPGTYFSSSLFTDISGDGILDLVCSDQSAIKAFIISPTSDLTIRTIGGTSNIGPIRVADFNGDGRMDIFAGVGSTNNTYRVWTNNGASFSSSADHPFGMWVSGYEIHDLDMNGIPDLLFHAQDTIYRSELNPDHSLGQISIQAVTDSDTRKISPVDQDNDGTMDLIIITENDRLWIQRNCSIPSQPLIELFSWDHRNSNYLFIAHPDGVSARLGYISNYSDDRCTDLLLYNSEPSEDRINADRIKLAQAYSTNGSASIKEADLDGDGDLDLLGALRNWGPFADCHLFALENQNGAYVQHCLGDLIPPGPGDAYEVSKLDVFDVNDDGLQDVMISGSWIPLWGAQNPMPGSYVLVQNSPYAYALGTVPIPDNYYRNRHDLNGDGLEDLITMHGADTVVIYRNDGGGNFTALAPLWIDRRIGAFWTDANGDGVVDVIGGSASQGILTYYYHTVTLNSISDATIIFQESGIEYQQTGSIADLDQDGDLDVLYKYRIDDGTLRYELDAYVNQGTYPLTQRDSIYTGRSFEYIFADLNEDVDLDIVILDGASLSMFKNNSTHDSYVGTGSGYKPFSLFPNPTSGKVFVDLGYLPAGLLDFIVFDPSGRMVQRTSTRDQITTLDVAGLSAGMYTVHVVDRSYQKEVRIGRLVISP